MRMVELEPLTTVHRFDQRGCGGSDDAPEYTFARYIADLEALRRHWGHDDWVVVGHSFGATLALAYAAANPGRTRAVGYLSGVGDWRSAYQLECARRRTATQQRRLTELGAQPIGYGRRLLRCSRSALRERACATSRVTSSAVAGPGLTTLAQPCTA